MSDVKTKKSTNIKPRPPDPNSTALVYSASEVAYLLNKSCQFVYKYAGSPRLPKPIRVGRGPEWNRKKFDKWMDDGCPKGAR